MRKGNKETITKLEQIYQSTVNNFRRDNDTTIDVPDTPEDNEYKTNIPVGEDIVEPVIKTKKGKTVLREPPVEDPKDNEIKDVEFLDVEGDEIKTLDQSSDEDTVTDLDDEKVISEQTEEKKKKEPKVEDEDPNDMGSIAQDNMSEQNPEEGTDPNADQGTQNPDPTQNISGVDPTATQDPNAMAGGMGEDPTMGGLGSDPNVDPMTGEKKKTPHDIGRIYELKKIYGRLLAIESQLSFSSDVILLRLRKFVSDAVELFETLISNIDAYLEQIDDIIVMYYDFLEEIYEILKKYYKGKQAEDKKENKQK